MLFSLFLFCYLFVQRDGFKPFSNNEFYYFEVIKLSLEITGSDKTFAGMYLSEVVFDIVKRN